MFLRRQHLQSRNMQRVVIGAGALGLFLYHCLEQEYSQKTLKIISNSWFQKPIMIESLDKHVDQLNPSSYFLAENLEKTFPLLSEKTIIFYICLPPEASLTALNYIEIILNKNPQIKTNVILFMNNGILDYQYLTQFIKKDSLHRCRETYCMRALVVSGFMRTFLDNKILIQNTSGKEIYYGFFKNKPPFSINFILPKNYLTWHYSKNIFAMEIAKFFVNFTLGLYIGPQYLPNSNIYLLLNDKKLNSTMRIFCLLFNDKNINIKYLEKYFHETINKTALNINSVSLSWLHGNDKPIKYFTSTVEKMIKLNHNREVKKFFIDLIDSQLVKLNR